MLAWSGLNPKDQLTWLLEVAPAIIGAVILLFTYKTFQLSSLLYSLILLHCIVLMIGGHYTYAEDAKAFLGTQGYIWDTQSDMAIALMGAVIALLTLSGIHDRQLNRY